jgi:hypothetical protein
MEYELVTEPVMSICCPARNMSIPLDQDNVEFCRFWLWNSANGYPIELPEDFIGVLDLDRIRAMGSDIP